MNLIVIGTNHHIASVSIRERLAALATASRHWCDVRATTGSAMAECFVLSTCHRVEVYAATSDLTAAESALLRLCDSDGRPVFDTVTPRYRLSDADALRHLCRVACGLDSVIVGEAEISGQVRRAAALAREAGTLGPYLERMVAAALRCSGRARAETNIARGVLSAASAAVTLMRHRVLSLASSDVLVVGAGQTGRQVLSRLARLDVGRLFVASRSNKHAQRAARESGATVLPFEEVGAAVRNVDVLFTTLQAPAFVICPADLGNRSERPLFAVDLSVPRAIDPAVADLEIVTLRTVDDLGDIARASLDRRAAEVPRVEAIADDEARRAMSQIRSRASRGLRR